MRVIILLAALSVSIGLGAQAPEDTPQKLFEAGRYGEALGAVAAMGPAAPPASIYLAGQSRLRLSQIAEARADFGNLSGVGNPWPLIGQSATALVDGNHALAIQHATQATEIAPAELYAHFQLGLAHSAAEQWEPAAAAFETAIGIDPTFAYSYYYAGLAHSRLRRVDQMATRLEYFLTLAPDAPEHSAVMTLMRSVRGR